MEPELSESERKVFDFVQKSWREHGRGPSLLEGAAACGWSSTRAWCYHVDRLVGRGVLARTGEHRSLRIAPEYEPEPRDAFPFGGLVAAGRPLANIDRTQGWLDVRELFPGSDLVTYRVRGESMIDAHVTDGDYIIVQPGTSPPNGTRVVVRVGDSLTLKVIQCREGVVWLHPCNAKSKRIRLDSTEDVEIVGTLAGVIRKEG